MKMTEAEYRELAKAVLVRLVIDANYRVSDAVEDLVDIGRQARSRLVEGWDQ